MSNPETEEYDANPFPFIAASVFVLRQVALLLAYISVQVEFLL